jgi:hypothetical protein
VIVVAFSFLKMGVSPAPEMSRVYIYMVVDILNMT